MRLRKGQIVEVRFLDHVENAAKPIAFVVFGELTAISPKAITVASWSYEDKALRKERKYAESNEVSFTIVRAAITRIRQLTGA